MLLSKWGKKETPEDKIGQQLENMALAIGQILTKQSMKLDAVKHDIRVDQR